MKRIVLGGTIMAAFAMAGLASMVVPFRSTAAPDAQPTQVATQAATQVPSGALPVTDTGRPPVPLVRKREPAPSSAAEPPAAPPTSGGQGAAHSERVDAMPQLPSIPIERSAPIERPVPIERPAWIVMPAPSPPWLYPGVTGPAPVLVSRGGSNGYMLIPLDDGRVLMVTRERYGGRDEKEGKKEKRRRRAWD
jgi:hypothetical protein